MGPGVGGKDKGVWRVEGDVGGMGAVEADVAGGGLTCLSQLTVAAIWDLAANSRCQRVTWFFLLTGRPSPFALILSTFPLASVYSLQSTVYGLPVSSLGVLLSSPLLSPPLPSSPHPHHDSTISVQPRAHPPRPFASCPRRPFRSCLSF